MPCVTINARMANSAASCLYAAVLIIFHESPLVAVILAGIPTTLFLYLRQSVLLPLPHRSAHSSCRFCQSPLSQHGSNLGTHLACSPAHWQKATGSSLCIPIRHWCSALDKLNFFISILSWRYTHLFSAKLRSGCLFSFGPAWTASGLGQ